MEMVPVQSTQKQQRTTYTTVQEPQTYTWTECVPSTTYQNRTYTTYRCVPRTITETVPCTHLVRVPVNDCGGCDSAPACGGCGHCSSCGGHGLFHRGGHGGGCGPTYTTQCVTEMRTVVRTVMDRVDEPQQ